jgi:hypothetical protein
LFGANKKIFPGAPGVPGDKGNFKIGVLLFNQGNDKFFSLFAIFPIMIKPKLSSCFQIHL